MPRVARVGLSTPPGMRVLLTPMFAPTGFLWYDDAARGAAYPYIKVCKAVIVDVTPPFLMSELSRCGNAL